MPRRPRTLSESGYYHVIQRGAGKQLIFEDDADRTALLETVHARLREREASLLAYCLMDNHVHLLVDDPANELSSAFQSSWTAYARRYNMKSGRVGPVFQGRFTSVPVESDAQLLLTARYIHENPMRAGICATEAYPWSSYQSYLRKEEPDYVSRDLLLDMFGGAEEFERFHQEPSESRRPYYPFTGGRIPDSEATQAALSALHPIKPHELKGLTAPDRNAGISRMREAGLTVRQIVRLTGIGRKTIFQVAQ